MTTTEQKPTAERLAEMEAATRAAYEAAERIAQLLTSL
jgi:hypothetical protein